MRPLNICIISQEFPPHTNWGGIAAYNSDLARMFCQLGHDVTVVSRAEKGAPRFEILTSGAKVWRIGKPIKRKYFIGRTLDRIFHAIDVERKVKDLDAQKRFDVIETTEAGLEGERLLRDEHFRSRMVIQCNGSNALGVMPDNWLAFIHWFDWKWSFAREKNSITLARHVLVTTDATRQFLIDQGVEDSKIHLIFQGIDTRRFSLGNASSNSWLEVGFAGRLERRKGIDYVWKVMELIGPNARIRFHFTGAIHPSMGSEVKENMNRFRDFATYHGTCQPEDMPLFYHSLHVLLQPSRFENFGLVYVEGMASGLIVFAGIGGGGSEIIETGRTGFLIDPDGDPELTAKKLREIAANLPKFDGLRHSAREEVKQRFSLETCAYLKIDYYRERIVSQPH